MSDMEAIPEEWRNTYMDKLSEHLQKTTLGGRDLFYTNL